MADTAVLEAAAERRGSSTLPRGTKQCRISNLVITPACRAGLGGFDPLMRRQILAH